MHTALGNQVNDTCRICKRGHVFADLVDGEDEILGQLTRELGLCLVPNDDDGRGRVGMCLGPNEGSADKFGERRVDAAAEALVRRDDDEELALRRFFWGRRLEDFYNS